jgi:hypothetical protein
MHACENAAIASNGEAIVSAEELMMEMSFVGLKACSVILPMPVLDVADDAEEIGARASKLYV